MGDPSLILGPHLAMPVDAAHPQHRGRHAVAARIIQHILVGRALGTAIGRVEVERPVLADAMIADRGVDWRIAIVARGEIQVGQRWNRQMSATPPPGANGIDPNCISICLIGDFDRTVPTPTQVRRLAQLVATLQSRLGISGSAVMVVNQPQSPAGAGRYFPVTALREQLLP